MRINILIIIAILYTFSFSCSDSGPDDSIPVIPKDSCLVYEYIKDSNSMINAYYKFDSTPGFGYEEHNLFASNFLFENLFQSGLKLKINK